MSEIPADLIEIPVHLDDRGNVIEDGPPEGHTLTDYTRIPFAIGAYRLSLDNIDEVARWCGGNKLTISRGSSQPDETRLEVPVWHPSPGQSGNARVGDWVTKTPKGFKIYTNRSFRLTFAPKQ